MTQYFPHGSCCVDKNKKPISVASRPLGGRLYVWRIGNARVSQVEVTMGPRADDGQLRLSVFLAEAAPT